MSVTKYFAEEKIWRSPTEHTWMFSEKANLGRIILEVLNCHSPKVIQISDDSGVRMTNREIASDAEKIAVGLRQRGAKQGDVVGFVARNGSYLTPALIACFYLDLPINALDVTQNEDEIYSIFRITKPKFIFCDDDMVYVAHKILERLQSSAVIVVIGNDVSGDVNIEELMQEGDSDELKKSLFFVNLLTCLLSGVVRVITTAPFSPEIYVNIVEKYKVTHTLISPIYLNSALESTRITPKSFLSLRTILCIGSLTTDDLVRKLGIYALHGKLFIAYGMSELGSIANYLYEPPKKVCVGILAPGNESVVIAENGDRLGPGETGELCFRTPHQMIEYIENPEATKNSFTNDGFFRTGDLGFYSHDGFLHIVGRCKDLIKYFMSHVSCSEIEKVIKTHPGVRDATVVGISDATCYQLPAAVVARRKNFAISANDIYEIVAKNLPDSHKLRGGIYFVDDIQVTSTGKHKKREIEKYATKMFEMLKSNNDYKSA
uniref:Acyl-coa synthetase n=2 Tax=Lutzomyia longipalpis TaxID=7200 RepID=A0A1B0GL65_LUTLO